MVNIFAKHSVIAFPTISDPIVGFLPCGPKFCSRPFYCPRAEIENFVISPLDVVLKFFCDAFT
jgi:hypothetical protein